MAKEGWTDPTTGKPVPEPPRGWVGGYSPSAITEKDLAYVGAHHKKINEKLETNYEKYEIVREWTQVVNGVNYYFNLEAEGRKYSVEMFKPLQEGVDSEVTMAVEGWIDPVVKVLSKDRQEEAEDPSQALSNPENRLVS